MKRFFMTMAVAALTTGAVMAQGNSASLTKAVSDSKAKIAKSDTEISDAKKGGLSKTWDNRGKVFYEAYNAPIKDINPGLPVDKEVNPLYNIEFFVGAPDEKTTQDEFEVWTYPTCKVYVQNGAVQFAVATTPADDKALEKSIEAYRKASALDPKGTYRTNEKTLLAVQDVRKAFFMEGGNYYMLKDYPKASYYFEQSVISDFDFPKSDESISIGQSYYNAGLSAYFGKDYDRSKAMLEKAIENRHEIGSCFQYLFLIMKEKGELEAGIKLIKDAYDKNPNEINILYALIDAYAGDKKYDEAIEYLDKAIANDSEKAIFYFVKGNMYKGKSQEFKTQYIDKQNVILSIKKEAYRARNNAAELAKVNAKMTDARKEADDVKAKFINLQNVAEKNYKTALEKDANMNEALLLMAELYRFDQLEVAEAENSIIQPSEANAQELTAAKEKEIASICKKAVDLYEKSYSLKEDSFPLQHLKALYYKLQDTANYNKVKALLEK